MKRFLETILLSIVGAVLLSTASLSAAGEMEGMTHKHQFRAAGEIDVMTQNQYLGADLTPLLEAATSGGTFDLNAFNTALVEALKKIAASSPAERVRALAEQIAQRNPDVVGLQEAFMFKCEGMDCDDPAIKDAFTDHLQNTEEALREKYDRKGRVTNLKVDNIPFWLNGQPDDHPTTFLSIVDRDAILVRKDLRASLVPFSEADCPGRRSEDGCNYEARFKLPLPPQLNPIVLVRGFLAVDVTVKGWHYRVFNTHLEQRLLADPFDPSYPRPLQVRQADELVNKASATWDRWDGISKTVIVIGDINSDPRDKEITLPGGQKAKTPYQIFTSNGFADAWTLRYHHRPGLTCCQDEDLENRRSELYERIDMIFSLRQPSRVLDLELFGNKKRDKTDPPPKGGLWPSDHAALAATLTFKSVAFAGWVGDRD